MTLTQINKAGLDEIALDHVFTIGASGSSAYTFQGEGLNGTVNNPTLYLTRGKTYRFENGSGGHPIRIQSTSGASGTAYNTGVTNNAGSGTVIVEVQHDAPDVLYYQCTSHAAMNGILYITGALADGGVTTAKIADDAVTTAKIAGTAITAAKIASGSVTSAKLADNSVTLAKMTNNSVGTNEIADQAVTLAKLPHGTSSNDGKFLRANNGADPSFETVSIPAGTTINNNADNRIITGSGTANTLEAESVLTFDSSTDTLQVHQQNAGNNPAFKSIHRGGSGSNINAHFTNYSGTSNTVILHDGKVGINTTSPIGSLDVYDGTLVLSKPNSSGNERNWRFLNNNVAAGNLGLQVSTAAGGSTFSNVIEIESNGNIGIGGQTNPTTNFHIKDKTAHGYELRLSGNAVTLNRDGPAYINQEGTGDLSFRMGSGQSEKLRILNGGGITFNGDTAAANALDDYEEGTWTPQGNGFSINNIQSARYTKIGRLVHVTAYINCGTGSGTSAVIVNNLPFNTRGGNAYSYGSGRIGSAGSNTNSQNNIVWQTQSGSNQLKLYVNDGAVNEGMISGQHMIFSIVYEH